MDVTLFKCNKCGKDVAQYYTAAEHYPTRTRVFYCSKVCLDRFSKAAPFLSQDSTSQLGTERKLRALHGRDASFDLEAAREQERIRREGVAHPIRPTLKQKIANCFRKCKCW